MQGGLPPILPKVENWIMYHPNIAFMFTTISILLVCVALITLYFKKHPVLTLIGYGFFTLFYGVYLHDPYYISRDWYLIGYYRDTLSVNNIVYTTGQAFYCLQIIILIGLIIYTIYKHTQKRKEGDL